MESTRVCFFIVVLTKQGKLFDAYVNAVSLSEAMDKLIEQFDLAGNIVDFKFCLVRK